MDYYVYTDGACYNNGKPNAIAGYGIYFGQNDLRNISKKIIGKQTNNIAELYAVIDLFNIIKEDIINNKKIGIYTDSTYVIKCLSSYGKKCHDNNWIKNIPNKLLVKTAYELYKNYNNVYFIHIKAHTNNQDIHSIGNYYADKLANDALKN
jgi:ribonuclease HI